jgi:hypothetical protein
MDTVADILTHWGRVVVAETGFRRSDGRALDANILRDA